MSHHPRWIAGLLGLLGGGSILAGVLLLPAAQAGRASPAPGLAACDAPPVIGPGATAHPGAFWKIEAELDGQGTLVGQRLAVGDAGTTRAVEHLATESSISGPVDGVVAVSSDDGRQSTVRLVAAAVGCAAVVHQTAAVVRRAIIDPADGSLLLHLLSRAGRVDLGIWRLVPGETALSRMVEPLPASVAAGPVWATDLRLDGAGRRLAVQSCFERTCLTRVVDLEAPDRAPIILRGARQGPMLGLAGDDLLTWAACDGYPCTILAWDAASRDPRTIVEGATAAGITGDGSLLVVTRGDGVGPLVVDLLTGNVRSLHGLAAGDRPLLSGGLAAMGLETGPAELAVSQRAGAAHAIRPTAAGEVLP